MNERIKKIKEIAQNIINGVSIYTASGDSEYMQFLVDIEKKDINDNEIEIVERIVNNLGEYFKVKEKMLLIQDDYNYLKEIAQLLREQNVRVEDAITFGNPIFKIHTNNEEEFVTRKGAEQYIEANSIKFDNLESQIENNKDTQDRRKNNIYDVKTNNNLQIAKILDIIKRNF